MLVIIRRTHDTYSIEMPGYLTEQGKALQNVFLFKFLIFVLFCVCVSLVCSAAAKTVCVSDSASPNAFCLSRSVLPNTRY